MEFILFVMLFYSFVCLLTYGLIAVQILCYCLSYNDIDIYIYVQHYICLKKIHTVTSVIFQLQIDYLVAFLCVRCTAEFIAEGKRNASTVPVAAGTCPWLQQ